MGCRRAEYGNWRRTCDPFAHATALSCDLARADTHAILLLAPQMAPMVSQNSYDGIDKYAADLIRHKARQLSRQSRIHRGRQTRPRTGTDDRSLQRMRHFNPAKAKKTTFMARIVERHISTILEARFAQCRDWRLCQTSLNEPLDNGEGDTTEWIDFLEQRGLSGKRHPRDKGTPRP